MPEEPSNVHVTSALPDDIREAVAVNNVKTLGEAVAFNTSLAMANAVAHQNRMNTISEAATSQAVKSLLEVDPVESMATQKLLSGNDLAAQLSQLMAALNSGQQGVKSAGNTPPVTP